MNIAILQPRVSYYNGGGEKNALDSIRSLARGDQSRTIFLYTLKSILPETAYYQKFKEAVAGTNVVVVELSIPQECTYLYDIQPGENRFRWDAESLFFNRIVLPRLTEDSIDIVWSYYLMDMAVKPVGIPAVLYLLGYPKNKSDYRDAIIAQYDEVVAISENTVRGWNDVMDRKIGDHSILHQGIQVDLETKRVSEFTDEYFNIVFAGRFIERKGVCTLLHALRRVIDAGESKVRLFLLGEGVLLETMKK